MIEKDQLAGTWELDYISGPRIAFEGLYPGKKPFLKIEVDRNQITGSTSCNRFFGPLHRTGNSINFKDGLGMTKMACPGQGEQTFLNSLQKIDTYAISNNGKTLNLLMGDIALMRFQRQGE
ncbi:hypothetical protein GCM10023231_06510 [Olivibacter ginsenosidimutans]|uniref:DUF306 domain-containing protein n=2 Tax=Olivibacter ginsenosidimutans TaxID=1176537 RepID=A0ABP9ALB0_9SPHI